MFYKLVNERVCVCVCAEMQNNINGVGKQMTENDPGPNPSVGGAEQMLCHTRQSCGWPRREVHRQMRSNT